MSSDNTQVDYYSVYLMALSNAPEWEQAKYQFLSSLQQVPIARSNLLPKLNYSYQRSHDHLLERQEGYSDQSSKDNYLSTDSNIQLSQPLFNMASYENYKRSKQLAKSAHFSLERARQSLAVQVLRKYIQVLSAQDQLILLNSQQKLLNEQSKQAQAFYKEGQGTLTDELEVKSQRDILIAKIIQAKNSLDDAEDKLSALIGVSINGRYFASINPKKIL